MLHQSYRLPFSQCFHIIPSSSSSGHSPTILWTKSWLLLPEHERRTHFNKFLVDRTLFPHSVIYKPFKQQPESPVVKICLAISGEGVDFKVFSITLWKVLTQWAFTKQGEIHVFHPFLRYNSQVLLLESLRKIGSCNLLYSKTYRVACL